MNIYKRKGVGHSADIALFWFPDSIRDPIRDPIRSIWWGYRDGSRVKPGNLNQCDHVRAKRGAYP